MRRILRVLLQLLTAAMLGVAIGRIFESRYPQQTDPEAEEFALAAFFNGREYESRAAKLRGGTTKTVLGGMDLDLTGAELDPAGATVNLDTTLGGVRLLVPPGWRVELIGDAVLGENTIDIGGQNDLDEDSPRLTVYAKTLLGGTLITTDPANELTIAIEI